MELTWHICANNSCISISETIVNFLFRFFSVSIIIVLAVKRTFPQTSLDLYFNLIMFLQMILKENERKWEERWEWIEIDG